MKTRSSTPSARDSRKKAPRSNSKSRKGRSAPSSNATLKQGRYVKGLLDGKSKKQSALEAGYAVTTAENAKQKIEKPRVRKLIASVLARQSLSAERVLEELRRIAFADVGDLFDARGNLRAVKQLGSGVGSTIAAVEVVKRNLTAGDGATDEIHKVKLWDKVRALETLAKHFRLLVERVEVDVKDAELTAKLLAGRKRLQRAETDRSRS